MKYLFDIIHPSNVHYFKGIIFELKKNGHQVVITARNKDITHALLNAYELDFIDMGTMKKSIFSKIVFLLKGEFKALNIIRKHRPQIVVSMASINFSHACYLTRTTFIAFDDSEHAKANRSFYSPFATKIFTPKSYQLDLGKKHFKFDAFMELFYLHPNQFNKWRVEIKDRKYLEDEFAIVRFIAWEAFHDVGQNQKTVDKLELVKRVSSIMKVYVSTEGDMPEELRLYRLNVPSNEIHTYLEKAKVYIGEGATTASECAMLGTPAIYINPLNAGTLMMQEQWGLLYNLGNKENVIESVIDILKQPDIKEQTKAKRNKIIQERIDPSAFFYWYLTNYPESDKLITEQPEMQYNFK